MPVEAGVSVSGAGSAYAISRAAVMFEKSNTEMPDW